MPKEADPRIERARTVAASGSCTNEMCCRSVNARPSGTMDDTVPPGLPCVANVSATSISRVLGNALRERAIDAGAISRHHIAALIAARKRSRHIEPVAAINEIGRVDEQPPIFHRKQAHCRTTVSPEGLGSADPSRQPGLALRLSAIIPVLEHDEHAVAVAIEPSDVVWSVRAAVDPDRIRPETRGAEGRRRARASSRAESRGRGVLAGRRGTGG